LVIDGVGLIDSSVIDEVVKKRKEMRLSFMIISLGIQRNWFFENYSFAKGAWCR